MASSVDTDTLSVMADRVSFLSKLVLLNKATSDDEIPTPGYRYKEICDITYESGSYCQSLLEYLVSRLEKKSYHVKLKTLRIMRELVEKGQRDFLLGLRKNAHTIRLASNFSGPPDPLHGNAPYMMVRNTAKTLSEILFDTDYESNNETPQSVSAERSGGMGPSSTRGIYEGFGNSQEKPKTLGESIVSGLKDIAERVSDQNTWHNAKSTNLNADMRFTESYKPVQLNSSYTDQYQSSPSWQQGSTRLSSQESQGHVKGIAGGGWEDDEHVNLNEKSEFTGITVDKIGGFNRLTAKGDCLTEMDAVQTFMSGGDSIPSRSELKAFMKRCSSLNCDVCVQLLNEQLATQNAVVVMRTLVILEWLLRTDVTSADHIACICHHNLKHLFKQSKSPVQSKSRKLIRMLQKLSRYAELFEETAVTNPSDELTQNVVQSGESPQDEILIGDLAQNVRISVSERNSFSISLCDDIKDSSFTFLHVPFADMTKSNLY